MPFSLSPLTVLNVALYGLTITMILVITLFINTRLRPLSVLLCVAFGALNTLSVVLLKDAFILPVSAVTVLVWSFVRAFSKKKATYGNFPELLRCSVRTYTLPHLPFPAFLYRRSGASLYWSCHLCRFNRRAFCRFSNF